MIKLMSRRIARYRRGSGNGRFPEGFSMWAAA
jgi:hypothetical protein